MIQKIKLTNFKCFPSVELSFRELNVFSGVNSMGKSTVIQSLLLLRQTYENNAIDRGLYLNGKYISIGTGKDLLYSNAGKEPIGIYVQSEVDQFDGWYEYNASADYLRRMAENREIEFHASNLFQDGFEFISADRLGPQLSYEKSYYEVHERKSIGQHGEYAVHFLVENRDQGISNKSVLYPDGQSEKLQYQTEMWMSGISPGVRIDFDNYDGANSVGLRIRQKNKDETTSDYFSVRNVGFGISYVLPIVLSLLKAQKGDLVILENPEAHLHPRGQRMMGELVARAAQGGVQVILETHSDHLMNGIRIGVKNKVICQEKVQINFFQNNQMTGRKEILNPQIQEDGRLSSWPDGFFDEWDKAIDEMF